MHNCCVARLLKQQISCREHKNKQDHESLVVLIETKLCLFKLFSKFTAKKKQSYIHKKKVKKKLLDVLLSMSLNNHIKTTYFEI